LYLVIGTIVFAVRSWTVVGAHVALLGASYAAVLIGGPSQFAPVARWLSVMTTIMVVGIFVRWLVGTVTGLAVAERLARDAAEAAAVQLERENRIRTRFLARMSHELRTPLNVVLGFSDLLSEQVVGPLNEPQQEYVRDVSDSARHLVALVDDVLDLESVETGDVRILPGPVDPAELAADSAVMIRDRAAAKSIDVVIDVPGDLGSIVGDRIKLRQVMVNLLANAVRFTPVNGTITVSARQIGTEIEFAVDDTGPGVAPEDRERIFEEYGQSSDSAGGTGLGLALARRFVELHGGSITVQDCTSGGSSFRFTVPLRHDSVVPQPRGVAESDAEADYSAFVRPGSRANRVLIGRISARLFLLSAIPALTVALFTPYSAPVRWSAAAAAVVLALVSRPLTRKFANLSFSQVEWCGWVGVVCVTLATLWAGPAEDTIPYGYAWLTMIAFGLWPQKRAMILLIGTGIIYALVLIHLSPPDPVVLWVAIMTLLTFNAETLSWVTARLRSLVIAEQAAHREARRVRAQLAAASQHKSSFVANMSHELRTPLNAVIGFTDLLASGLAGPLNEEQQDYVRDIGEAARHLLAIINDVLDTAKIDAGQLSLNPDVIPLRSLLERAIELGNPPGPGQLADIRLDIEAGLDFVYADQQRLEQVLIQLVSNGVKFTPTGGRVEVSACTAALGEVHVTVTDSGIGILPEQVPRIFDAFHQGTRLLENHVPAGTGLGLSLAKSLVEMHGGRIWVTSRPDRGSTFTVALPAPVPAERPIERPVRQMS
ncbi:MAG TPA: HAMP domain-containing sensor histidine kinase, partial [Jatrophihabitantaceae bacterium]|nr:HAMP domain-containing sensor histidine kinase [Jatrophihabitantaceae bacterium]